MSTIRDFVPLLKLGEGTYSSVYKVRRSSDQKIYALKKVKMNNLSIKQKQNALNQIRILASIESPFIVGYKQAFFDDKLQVLCIVMQFADSGDLQRIIMKNRQNHMLVPEMQIWKAICNCLDGLAELHLRGILHRDMKSANIFKHGSQYKLGDMNVSKVNGDRLAYTQTGTPYYASPQVWRDQPYGSKSDLWSFGCIIYEMACLKPPFQGKNMDQLYYNVQNKPYKSLPNVYSQQLRQIINICLSKKPQKRLSANQLLNSPLLQSIRLTTPKNREKTVANEELLKTIKLPFDLKALKKSLPAAKYDQKIIINKPKIEQHTRSMEYLNSQRPRVGSGNVGNNIYQKQVPLRQKVTSPRQLICLKSKAKIQPSIIVINQGITLDGNTNSPIKYSQRLFVSDHKKNQINNRNSHNINKYIQNELRKKSNNSMPRTQNSMILKVNEKNKAALQEWKNNLIKKNRILSSNNQKRIFLWNR